jgi:uncharacterized protein with PhoU and TrkA domain
MSNYKAAFLMVQEQDGSWTAVSDITQPFETERLASVLDIKHACQQVLDVVTAQEIADLILREIKQGYVEDSQRISASMRDAINRRKAK